MSEPLSRTGTRYGVHGIDVDIAASIIGVYIEHELPEGVIRLELRQLRYAAFIPNRHSHSYHTILYYQESFNLYQLSIDIRASLL